MAKCVSIGIISLVLYGILITPFSTYLLSKPVSERLGYVPTAVALKIVAADHKEMVAASLVIKVLMYFGGLTEKQGKQVIIPPDYRGMSRLLHGAVKLDPYNMDAYYFAQSFLTWDAGQFKLANDLLDYGMKYRNWDWYLPFFAGFNSAYFLKDYSAAAKYYQKAGELSGSNLSKLLAGRYLQESGQTDFAIAYLTAMEKGENNQALKKSYKTRLDAFREVRRIELARDRYKESKGRCPETVMQLIRGGYLSSAPVDPYGGEFYLGTDCKVTTTSKFAYAHTGKQSQDK